MKRNVLVACLPLAVVASSSSPLSALDWPEWRGPGRAGVWEDVKLPERLEPSSIERLWTASIGGGYAGIAVVGERVLTLDRPKGSESERIVCLSSSDGRLLWKHEHPADYGKMEYDNGPRSTPTVRDGRVFTQGAMGHVHALDLETGKVHWTLDVASVHGGKVPEWGHAPSPLRFDDLVLVQAGGAPGPTVLALEAAGGNGSGGRERWRALSDEPGYSSAVLLDVAGKRQIGYWSAENAVGIEPGTGEVLWRVPFKSTYRVAIISPVLRDGLLLVSGFWEGSKVVRIAGPAEKEPPVVWSGKSLSCLMSTPLWRDGVLYALDKDSGLLGVEWTTGKVLWSDGHKLTPKERNPQASMVWAGDRAVMLNARGELILARLSKAGYEELGRVKVCGNTWSHPAFAGDRIYVRCETELSCWRIKPSP